MSNSSLLYECMCLVTICMLFMITTNRSIKVHRMKLLHTYPNKYTESAFCICTKSENISKQK